MTECCICLDELNQFTDIKLNCCKNLIHKECFNHILETFLECPICRELVYLEMPSKKWYSFMFQRKNKNIFKVKSQNGMLYVY